MAGMSWRTGTAPRISYQQLRHISSGILVRHGHRHTYGNVNPGSVISIVTTGCTTRYRTTLLARFSTAIPRLKETIPNRHSDTTDANPSRPPEASAVTEDKHAPLTLDVKHVDSRYDDGKDAWDYKDITDTSVPAERVQPVGTNTAHDESWSKYCFVVVRKHEQAESKGKDDDDKKKKDTISFDIVVKSPYLRAVCREAMAGAHGISWVSEPLEVCLFATVFEGAPTDTNLTGEKHASRLREVEKLVNDKTKLWYYSLTWEGLEEIVERDIPEDEEKYDMQDAVEQPHPARFGWVTSSANIAEFSGVEMVKRLSAYPLEFHSNPEAFKASLIERGRRWASLSGMHHMQYRGTGDAMIGSMAAMSSVGFRWVDSRIMVDKSGFNRVEPDYEFPWCDDMRMSPNRAESLTEDELLLSSPVVYGFSLNEKRWLEFNVNHVIPIQWNDEAFSSLVLPHERKELLRSLIEAHGRSDANKGGFDDFIPGKGQGLVINLFGPPGVGKTLSAEATSEHLRRPLYVVGSGDLGASASSLDQALEDAFELAASWNAVLLIDEADVFLEERSLHDMLRNAMVAVFLRHVEYYRGILFLTTNRIKAFDEAFLSRIHVALHFGELSAPTKAQIWRAFLRKAGIGGEDASDVTVERLARRDMNGRQIKNACKTASALALSRGEKLGLSHLEEALSAMEVFLDEFTTIQRGRSIPGFGFKA
ncbi:P-loop containing nucleoside triphosphate hydrolase protein [Daedaleopsis nitida]|nr:P-loop containing nucleoside triphosphate hydrolase protein [Daedaleopsis nitida]